MRSPTNAFKKVAFEQLETRRKNKSKPVDNSTLVAGQPMYYRCESCGYICDIKPEGWLLAQPRRFCGECQAMKDLEWI